MLREYLGRAVAAGLPRPFFGILALTWWLFTRKPSQDARARASAPMAIPWPPRR